MRAGWTTIALLLGGCGEDPSLRVEVTHHPDAANLVARTTISVYESDVVSCDKVEFGDLTAAELTAILVDEIAIADGEPAEALTMSREGTKVIVARGFDEAGAFVTAGCEEQGTVGEDDVLAIATELTASVSIAGIGLEDMDPFGIAVTVTDPFVRSLPERVVSWRVHGPFGATPFTTTNLEIAADSWVPAAPACTNANGLVRIHSTPPSTIGGFATAVRTSWSTEPPRVFTTFTPVNGEDALPMTPTSDGNNLSVRRCASRIDGSVHRLVCLQQLGTPTAIDYTILVADGGAQFTEVGPNTRDELSSVSLLPNEIPIGVFSVDRGPSTRDVYAMTTRGRMIGVFSPSQPADGQVKTAGTVTDVAVLPACGQTAPGLLVRVDTATGKKISTLSIDPDGMLGVGEILRDYVPPPTVGEDTSINATGCVAELAPGGEPTLRQVGVIDVIARLGPGRNSTTAHFPCDAGMCTIPLAIPRAGVGFLPADDQHPARMVNAAFDATGTVLSVNVLQPANDGMPRAVELERITAASFPQRVITGQFDGDGRPDLFWDIANFNTATTNLQLSYAHPVLGERLSALSGTLQNQLVVDSFVADVTGDGNDDVVVSLQDRPTQPTAHRVLVIPGQVAIPDIDLPQDPPCASP